MRNRKSLKLLIVAVVAIAGGAFMQGSASAYSSCPTNSVCYAADSAVGNYVGVKLSSVITGSAGAEVDTDITVGYYNNGNTPYLPCKNTGDTYFAACQFAPNPGYYKSICTKSFSPTNYFTVDNVNNSVTHLWAQRLQRVDVEIYPKTASTCGTTDVNYGRVRFAVTKSQFTHDSTKNADFTPNIGAVTLPKLGDPNVVKLNGHFYNADGSPATDSRDYVHIFEAGNGGTSQYGYGIASFGTGGPSSSGYYTSGPIYSGNYTGSVLMYDANGQNPQCKTFTITGWNSTNPIDFHFGEAGFGLGNYAGFTYGFC